MTNQEQTETTRNASGSSPPEENPNPERYKIYERYEFEFEYEPPLLGETLDSYRDRLKEAFQEQMEGIAECLIDGSDPVVQVAVEMACRKAWPSRTITEAALLKRINRKLAHENKFMRKARTWTSDLGWFYVVDRHTGAVQSAHHDDIVAFARDEGLVRPGERAEDCAASREAR